MSSAAKMMLPSMSTLASKRFNISGKEMSCHIDNPQILTTPMATQAITVAVFLGTLRSEKIKIWPVVVIFVTGSALRIITASPK